MSSSHNSNLVGKVALITGASRGIGEATARHLASLGTKVVVAARTTSALEALVSDIKATGGQAAAVAVDVADEKQIAGAIAFAEKTFGGLDFVFANAGTEGKFVPTMDQQPDDDIRQVINVNLLGPLYTLKYAVPALKRRGGGVIAFNSSASTVLPRQAFQAKVGFTVYASSKAGIDHLARSTTYYQADNIKVYSVLPAIFDTTMARSAAATETAKAVGVTDVAGMAQFNPRHKGKPGNPLHVGHLVASLFDGSTKYEPNTSIVIDNDTTWAAHEFFKTIEVGPSALENPRDIIGNPLAN